MTPPVAFTVYGVPVAQPRPRAFARRMGDKVVARMYDAGTADIWKSQIAEAARAVAPDFPHHGPVRVRVAFVMPRPKSHFRSNGELRTNAPFHHTGKPDIDNLQKALFDALTQSGGIWIDDSQIACSHGTKHYGPQPGAVVEIKAIEEAAQ